MKSRVSFLLFCAVVRFLNPNVCLVLGFIQHDVKEFLASMYAIINDTYRTTLCLQYLPSQIAMAVFYIASIQLSIKPATHSSNRSGSHDKTWLDLLEQDIDPSLLHGNNMLVKL